MSNDPAYLAARETLTLSGRTAARFVAQLGALAPVLVFPLPAAHLGRRPGLQATVLDHKYWFAKLYECVTYEEIAYAQHVAYATFWYQFIKVFYGLYYDALQKFLNGSPAPPLWQTHFEGPPATRGGRVPPDSMDAVEFSVRTGAIAHIQGDLPVALVKTYRIWTANPKPPFQRLQDAFVNGEAPFRRAQARFYLDVNDKTFSPLRPEVGQFAAAVYQSTCDIQPSLEKMFQWRRDAWQKAMQSL